MDGPSPPSSNQIAQTTTMHRKVATPATQLLANSNRSSNNNKKNKNRKKKNKNAQNNKRKSKLSLQDTIVEADRALATLDLEKALTFYTSAANILRSQCNSNDSNDSVIRTEQQQEEEDNGSSSSPSLLQKRELVRVLEKLGETKVSMGDQDGAAQEFRNALNLLLQLDHDDVDETTTKSKIHQQRAGLYLYIGQLSIEQEALDMYSKGIQELESALNATTTTTSSSRSANVAANADTSTTDMETDHENHGEQDDQDDPVQKIRNQLCKAHCTVAELFMTDLCFAENAEQRCESHVQQALSLSSDQSSGRMEALQSLASLRLSQNRGLEAIEPMLETFRYMRVGCQALASLVGLWVPTTDQDVADKEENNALELTQVDAANALPEFEFRCQTAKLLLECVAVVQEEGEEEKSGGAMEDNESNESRLANASIQVLGSLLAENDEVIEIWYLLGCAYASSQQNDLARHYLSRANEMLLRVQEELQDQHQNNADDDDEELQCQLQDIETQLGSIQAKLATIQQEDGDDDDDEDNLMEMS